MTRKLEFRSLTTDTWDDFVELFGPERGACAGCWCMWPRLRGIDFKALQKDERREAFRSIVRTGPAPGLLAYENRSTVGWVAISPRRAVHRFNISKNSAPTDDAADALDTVWAITCFFVRNSHRRSGLTSRLAEAAAAYAKKRKAPSV